MRYKEFKNKNVAEATKNTVIKTDDKYHYVYRITNTKLNKHYYGSRTSKLKPKEDIGIKYFSSSKDKDFIKDQKENFKDYKYKVVRVLSSKEEKIA